MTLSVLSAILSVKSNSMGKACCAVGSSNRFIRAFIFLKMKNVSPSGQQQRGAKIGFQMSTRGYVAYTSFRGNRATTSYPLIMFLPYSST